MMGDLKENEFLIDYHISNLIVFPPKTQLYDHPLVKVSTFSNFSNYSTFSNCIVLKLPG